MSFGNYAVAFGLLLSLASGAPIAEGQTYEWQVEIHASAGAIRGAEDSTCTAFPQNAGILVECDDHWFRITDPARVARYRRIVRNTDWTPYDGGTFGEMRYGNGSYSIQIRNETGSYRFFTRAPMGDVDLLIAETLGGRGIEFVDPDEWRLHYEARTDDDQPWGCTIRPRGRQLRVNCSSDPREVREIRHPAIVRRITEIATRTDWAALAQQSPPRRSDEKWDEVRFESNLANGQLEFSPPFNDDFEFLREVLEPFATRR